MYALTLALTLLLPKHGTLVPFRDLAGVRLGMTPAQVRAAWGKHYGRCRGCAETTWYFTYKPFQPSGAGVTFTHGKVSAVYTLWSPRGWRSGTLRIGDPSSELTTRYPRAIRIPCANYDAYIVTKQHVTTAFYVFDDKLWGFGLIPSNGAACR